MPDPIDGLQCAWAGAAGAFEQWMPGLDVRQKGGECAMITFPDSHMLTAGSIRCRA
jgi:hypothetical protein